MDKIKPASFYFSVFLFLLLLRILFMFKANLLVEEAYYWNYSTHLDFSFLDHPPMVALLIKLGTFLFGITEWGVRFPTIICWALSGYYSFKLTSLIQKKAGLYALMLLAILPFFFVHSLIITPDIPLILSWSASLYFLYKALVLDERLSWYWVGLWIGFGLLSKYTIVLVGVSTIVYLILDPASRKWFRKKEPYICALFALLLFTPVIYWNATHDWVSFLFQTSRRFHDHYRFTLHELIGLAIIYLTPTGILGAWMLFSSKYHLENIPDKTTYFLRIYTAVPFLFFALFSLCHGIRINWIGPICLAIIPWLAVLLANNQQIIGITFRKGWAISFAVMLCIYTAIIGYILVDKKSVSNSVFKPIILWDSFAQKTHNIAQDIYIKNHRKPIIVPLDSYHMASEYTFYQEKALKQGLINTSFSAVGSHVFDFNSLMYQYWGGIDDIKDSILLLVSLKKDVFSYSQIKEKIIPLSDVICIDYGYKKNGALVLCHQMARYKIC